MKVVYIAAGKNDPCENLYISRCTGYPAWSGEVGVAGRLAGARLIDGRVAGPPAAPAEAGGGKI